MDIRTYDSKIREVAHFTNGFGESYIIINQSYWFKADKYTEEEAIAKYKERKGIR